ncbi:uroporphyrinogen-III decarboxylase, partial [Candidatus Bipolaricaulota bacterium]|nr:uroporphyrinogen-III decarboxylase [Candidatus Bipolaricaulota bacterium]
ENLLEYLGEEQTETTITYINSQSVELNNSLRKRFNVDCVPIYLNNPTFRKTEIHEEDDGTKWYRDEWGVKWKKPASGIYYDAVEHPLSGSTADEIKKFETPDPRDPRRIKGLAEKAKNLYENTDYCLVVNGALGGTVFMAGQWLLGVEELFRKVVTEPETVEALLKKVLKFQLKQWEMILSEVGEYCQVGVIADDLGSQNNPLINPDIYRDLIKPYHKELCSFLKNEGDLKVVYHSDGAIQEFIPDLIDIGVDAWNPIQVSAGNLDDTAGLNREYGEKIAFWGGGCNKSTLCNGKPEDVRKEVRGKIEDLAPGGGFIASSIHNIQKDVPAENIEAFYKSLYEFGNKVY